MQRLTGAHMSLALISMGVKCVGRVSIAVIGSSDPVLTI